MIIIIIHTNSKSSDIRHDITTLRVGHFALVLASMLHPSLTELYASHITLCGDIDSISEPANIERVERA